MYFPSIVVRPKRRIKKVYIHCSASDNPKHDDVEVIRQWHLDRGWRDIGYHFFIRRDGTLDVGRDIELTPSAQKWHNLNTIAVCVHGLTKTKFTTEQFRTLQKLCLDIKSVQDTEVTFHGHNEVSAKACPVFEYRKLLALSSEGQMPIDSNFIVTDGYHEYIARAME